MACVLIVDDNATNRSLLATILGLGSHTALQAANGAEGLGLARVERPDVVIADLLMPKMDGYELVRELRADPLTASIPVIIHSAAYASHELRDIAQAYGIDQVLSKPADVETILDAVRRAVQDQPSAPPSPPEGEIQRQHLVLLNDKLLEKVRELEQADRKRRALLAQLVEAEERERERIANSIHDDSIQVMTAVAMRLEMLGCWMTAPESAEKHAELQEIVRRAIGRLRHLTFSLHPQALEREGLAAALTAFLEGVSRDAGASYEVDDSLGREPPHEMRILLYRIAQEALTNVAKHAKATQVTVDLADHDGGWRVRIVDDGVGFAAAAVQAHKPGHLGTFVMHQRAELAGGWWRVDSEPGKGTTVEFWVPAVEVTGE